MEIFNKLKRLAFFPFSTAKIYHQDSGSTINLLAYFKKEQEIYLGRNENDLTFSKFAMPASLGKIYMEGTSIFLEPLKPCVYNGNLTSEKTELKTKDVLHISDWTLIYSTADVFKFSYWRPIFKTLIFALFITGFWKYFQFAQSEIRQCNEFAIAIDTHIEEQQYQEATKAYLTYLNQRKNMHHRWLLPLINQPDAKIKAQLIDNLFLEHVKAEVERIGQKPEPLNELLFKDNFAKNYEMQLRELDQFLIMLAAFDSLCEQKWGALDRKVINKNNEIMEYYINKIRRFWNSEKIVRTNSDLIEFDISDEFSLFLLEKKIRVSKKINTRKETIVNFYNFTNQFLLITGEVSGLSKSRLTVQDIRNLERNLDKLADLSKTVRQQKEAKVALDGFLQTCIPWIQHRMNNAWVRADYCQYINYFDFLKLMMSRFPLKLERKSYYKYAKVKRHCYS